MGVHCTVLAPVYCADNWQIQHTVITHMHRHTYSEIHLNVIYMVYDSLWFIKAESFRPCVLMVNYAQGTGSIFNAAVT